MRLRENAIRRWTYWAKRGGDQRHGGKRAISWSFPRIRRLIWIGTESWSLSTTDNAKDNLFHRAQGSQHWNKPTPRESP